MVQDLKRAPEKPSGSCVWNGSLGSSTHESHQEPWARLPKDSPPAGKSTCGFNPGLKERCHPHHGGRGQGWRGGGVRAGPGGVWWGGRPYFRQISCPHLSLTINRSLIKSHSIHGLPAPAGISLWGVRKVFTWENRAECHIVAGSEVSLGWGEAQPMHVKDPRPISHLLQSREQKQGKEKEA